MFFSTYHATCWQTCRRNIKIWTEVGSGPNQRSGGVAQVRRCLCPTSFCAPLQPCTASQAPRANRFRLAGMARRHMELVAHGRELQPRRVISRSPATSSGLIFFGAAVTSHLRAPLEQERQSGATALSFGPAVRRASARGVAPPVASERVEAVVGPLPRALCPARPRGRGVVTISSCPTLPRCRRVPLSCTPSVYAQLY